MKTADAILAAPGPVNEVFHVFASKGTVQQEGTQPLSTAAEKIAPFYIFFCKGRPNA
jgi:hypothetical protein